MKPADLPSALRQSTGFLLGRAAAIARDDFRSRLVAHGVNAKHYTVLTYLAERGAQSQSTIGGALALDRTTMVMLVDELEHLDLVERGLDANNRRAYLVDMTAAGRRMLKRLARAADASDAAFQAGFDEADVLQLRTLLARIVSRGDE